MHIRWKHQHKYANGQFQSSALSRSPVDLASTLHAAHAVAAAWAREWRAWTTNCDMAGWKGVNLKMEKPIKTIQIPLKIVSILAEN